MEIQSTLEGNEKKLEEWSEQCQNDGDKGQIDIQSRTLLQLTDIRNELQYKHVNTLLRQILGSAGSLVISTCNGMTLGYSSILIPQLMDEKSDIKLTKEEASWIASMVPLQMASGCLIGGWAMEKFGRKPVNITMAFMLIIAWTFIVLASTGNHILIGRIILGFSTGMLGPSCICYVGEVADPKLRGLFLAGINLGVSFGIFLVHLLGTFYHWKTVAIISTCIPIIEIIIYSITPESYIFYFKKRKILESVKSFHWFRGYGKEAREELEAVLMSTQTHVMPQRTLKYLFNECRKPIFYKPFIVLNVCFLGLQFSGNNAIPFYSINIMQNTVPSLDKYTAMLIVDIVRIHGGIISCILTKKYRLRVLTMISGLGTTLSLTFLAIFSYLTEKYPNNIFYSTIPIIGLISFITFLSIGFAPLPWLICGEMFPPATKGIATGLSSCVNFILMFIIVKTNPGMFSNCGVAATYGMYGLCTLLATLSLYFILPETKNKTLLEIQSSFKKVQQYES